MWQSGPHRFAAGTTCRPAAGCRDIRRTIVADVAASSAVNERSSSARRES